MSYGKISKPEEAKPFVSLITVHPVCLHKSTNKTCYKVAKYLPKQWFSVHGAAGPLGSGHLVSARDLKTYFDVTN